MKQFSYERSFRSLSVKDLLDAREAYHIHLAHMNHVVATAIGLYRVRLEDLEDDGQTPKKRKNTPRSQHATPRTLANSKTTDWSWPCVLVFVDQWQTLAEMAGDPDQVVPQRLFLADGRVVPTCVVFAPQSSRPAAELGALLFPNQFVGGGYPVLSVVQNREHVGSIGCLVTDGDTTYALTNRHVAGEEGRPLYSVMAGSREQIGVSAGSALNKLSFTETYPGWPGGRVCVNLDAGLIRIDNLNRWTAQVLNIGELGPLIDMNVDTISLDLIGCRVRAFGAGSGAMIGRIDALFYRYRSVGGVDYVSDLLIGSRSMEAPLTTRPGDSGTLWLLDEVEDEVAVAKKKQGTKERPPMPRPIAVQWGGHVLRTDVGEGELPFALATFASTICRELDVDIVPDFNTGHPEYWGRVGHYKIGDAACDLLKDAKLKAFFQKNRAYIGYSDDAIKAKTPNSLTDASDFVPLADVPDIVWKHKSRSMEGPNHFADMDDPAEEHDPKSDLLHACDEKTGKNITVAFWNDFYEKKGIRVASRGCLPFRVWQIYNDMVQFVYAGDVTSYFAAAGVLAHYVGDACQPLHVSRLHHGGVENGDPLGKVHDEYEQGMLARNAAQLFTDLSALLKKAKADALLAKPGGKQAACDTVALMREAFQTISPQKIVDTYKKSIKDGDRNLLWTELRVPTEGLIVRGSVHLAKLWGSAWAEGNAIRHSSGRAVLDISDTGTLRPADLKTRYLREDFLASMFITHMDLKDSFQPARAAHA